MEVVVAVLPRGGGQGGHPSRGSTVAFAWSSSMKTDETNRRNFACVTNIETVEASFYLLNIYARENPLEPKTNL